MGLTNYGENKALDAILGGSRATAWPSGFYIALYTILPTADDGTGGTEVSSSGTSYARVSYANDGTNWPAASSSLKLNGTTITFPTASASWGTVVGYGFYDAPTSGNCYYFGPLSSNLTVNTGVSPNFPINSLGISAD